MQWIRTYCHPRLSAEQYSFHNRNVCVCVYACPWVLSFRNVGNYKIKATKLYTLRLEYHKSSSKSAACIDPAGPLSVSATVQRHSSISTNTKYGTAVVCSRIYLELTWSSVQLTITKVLITYGMRKLLNYQIIKFQIPKSTCFGIL